MKWRSWALIVAVFLAFPAFALPVSARKTYKPAIQGGHKAHTTHHSASAPRKSKSKQSAAQKAAYKAHLRRLHAKRAATKKAAYQAHLRRLAAKKAAASQAAARQAAAKRTAPSVVRIQPAAPTVARRPHPTPTAIFNPPSASPSVAVAAPTKAAVTPPTPAAPSSPAVRPAPSPALVAAPAPSPGPPPDAAPASVVAASPSPLPVASPAQAIPPLAIHSSVPEVPMNPTTAVQQRGALANTAWGVLKQALIAETVEGKFTDFREGAGAEDLKTLDTTAYMALMRELSEASEAAVRHRVVVTMATVDNVGSKRILIRALQDPSLAVRMEAAAILGTRGERCVVAVYKHALAAKSRDARYLVLRSMKRVGHKWMVNLLRAFLHDRDPFMRVSAAEGLARLGDEKAYMLLRRFMKVGDKYVRSSAYAAVKDAGGRRGMTLLMKALNDHNGAIRLYAAVHLAKIGNPNGLHVLEAALSDKSPAMRYTAVDALAQLQLSRSLQALVVALRDRDAYVRIRAAAGLLEHKKGNGIPVLQEAMHDHRVAVRVKAVETARLGCPGPGLPLLQAALTDPSRSVRAAAIDGLVHVAEVRDLASLRQLLARREVGIHVAAAMVLLVLDDSSAPAAMARYVKEDAPERDEILRLMEKLKVADISPYLKTIAMTGPEAERLAAIKDLALQDCGPATEALCAVARSSDSGALRMAAVKRLGTIPGDLSTYLLKTLLNDEVDHDLQVEAASILGERGIETAARVLQQAVTSNNLRAARALCKIGDPAGVRLYQRMLTSSDPGERIEAAIVLYNLKSHTRSVPVSAQ